ncbi:MAG TPA: Na+/H+ antiporter subunit E [Actinomycetota bacterium]|nr:Na+/H+ antiporter subunit E [Actinomycetota bacterium]
MNRILTGLWIATMWLLLWGEATPANIAGGVAVAAVLVFVFPAAPEGPVSSFRPVAACRFLLHFVYKLVEANLILAWEVATPRNRIREGVVAVPVHMSSRGVVTMVANAISLTPGTLSLEVNMERRQIYVHVLHLHDLEKVRRDLHRFEELALRAFGSPEELAASKAREEAR